MSTSPVLFTDADNTLWDTDEVYARAQHMLLAAISRYLGIPMRRAEPDELAFLRRIDQRIATRHPNGLRYPPSLLAVGLRRALTGDHVGSLDLAILEREDDTDLRTIIDEYVEALGALPILREGVTKGLELVRGMRSHVKIVTEGDESRCIGLLERHGLSRLVDDCVSVKKSVESYRSLAKGTKHGLMVGDQLDRDILFARQAGLRTCYFPGKFIPFWAQDLTVTPDFKIESYLDVPVLLKASTASAQRRNRV